MDELAGGAVGRAHGAASNRRCWRRRQSLVRCAGRLCSSLALPTRSALFPTFERRQLAIGCLGRSQQAFLSLGAKGVEGGLDALAAQLQRQFLCSHVIIELSEGP